MYYLVTGNREEIWYWKDDPRRRIAENVFTTSSEARTTSNNPNIAQWRGGVSCSISTIFPFRPPFLRDVLYWSSQDISKWLSQCRSWYRLPASNVVSTNCLFRPCGSDEADRFVGSGEGECASLDDPAVGWSLSPIRENDSRHILWLNWNPYRYFSH